MVIIEQIIREHEKLLWIVDVICSNKSAFHPFLGTCNNNRTEDCRLPNGTIISSCEKMAPYWHVSNNNSVCLPPNPKPTPVPCTNAPICEILST